MSPKSTSRVAISLAFVLVAAFGWLLAGRASTAAQKENQKQLGLVAEVAKLKSELDELKQRFQTATPPVGAIVAWHRDLTAKPLPLPAGWLECNGQKITAGPLQGYNTPALNEAKGYQGGFFLRGGTRSGTPQDATALFGKWEGKAANKGGTGAAVPGDDSQFAIGSDGTLFRGNAYWDAIPIKGTVEKEQTPFYYVRPVNMSVVWIMRVQ
jgi:hypothetical protein